MHLQGKILTTHRVQQIKTDRKFCTKPAMDALAEQLVRCIQNEILGRNF